MTIGEFFGTLQEAITAEWRKHLQTGKYSDHMALDEFYKEMPEKVDALIEAWQADNDVVEDYSNVLDDDMDALQYMEALKKHTKEGRKLLGSSELESLCDDILSLIDSTIYKLKRLKESLYPLTSFLNEALNETVLDDNPTAGLDADMDKWSKVVGLIQKFIDAGSMADNSLWELKPLPDFTQIESIVKKIKPTKYKKSDSLIRKPFIGFQVMDGRLNEIVVYMPEARWPKLCKEQHSNFTDAISISHLVMAKYSAWNYLDTRGMRGVRRTAYACPPEIVQQVYDIVKSKY